MVAIRWQARPTIELEAIILQPAGAFRGDAKTTGKQARQAA